MATKGNKVTERITINLTESDLAGGREYKQIPVGTWLPASIYEVETKYVKAGANMGKPYWSIDYKLLTEEYGKDRIQRYDNIMLFAPALFSLVGENGILQALNGGEAPTMGELVVPTREELLGKELEIYIGKHEASQADLRKNRDLEARRSAGQAVEENVTIRYYPAVTKYRPIGGGGTETGKGASGSSVPSTVANLFNE